MLCDLTALLFTPLLVIGNLLWFLELWQTKGKKTHDPKNKYAAYRIKLTPFLIIMAWLVLLLSLLCSFWTTYPLYRYSHETGQYLVILSLIILYFLVLFIVNFGMLYGKNWMMILLLFMTTFLILPALLNLHIVAWLPLAPWEILLLLTFSLSVFILEITCFGFEWLWVREKRQERNLKRQKKSPAWSRIFVIGLLVFALSKIIFFAYTEYRIMDSKKQAVLYYLSNHTLINSSPEANHF